METQQPMKMASAEALYNTTNGASFSIFAIGRFTRFPGHLSADIRIPHALSILATASWNGKVDGINGRSRPPRSRSTAPATTSPILGVTYWTFRADDRRRHADAPAAPGGLVLQRRKRMDRARWFQRLAIVGIFLPILANWTGWIFTEMGRQPWVVYGLLKTSQRRNSPNVAIGLDHRHTGRLHRHLRGADRDRRRLFVPRGQARARAAAATAAGRRGARGAAPGPESRPRPLLLAKPTCTP